MASRAVKQGRIVGTVAGIVTMALVASGCSIGGSSSTPKTIPVTTAAVPSAAVVATTPSVGGSQVAGTAQALASTASTAPTASTVAALASAGVSAVADESSTTPQVPVAGVPVLTVTQWQVTNMGAEVSSRDGVSGADLNTMLPMPANSPQLDDILGGWVLTAGDPAAATAAHLLGPVSWAQPEQVIFPTEVLTLFLADALQHAVGPGAAASTSGTAWRGSGSGGMVAQDVSLVSAPCSAVSGFVDGVLDRVFSILKINADEVGAYVSGKLGGGLLGAVVGGLFSFGAGLWNKAVDLAEQSVKDVLKSLTQPVLNALALVIGGVAVISTIRGILKHWSAPITPAPAANAFSVVDPAGTPGRFTVAIDTNAETEDWPSQLLDCADAAGVKLPTLATAGSPVTWTVEQGESGLIAPGVLTGAIDDKLTETLGYSTGYEEPQLAKTGTLVAPTVTVVVQVRRTEIEELRQFVTGYLTGKVPGILAPIVNPILTAYINYATQWLDLITAIRGQSTIVVTHHVPKPTPTPTVPPATSAGPAPLGMDICALMPSALVGSIKGRAVGAGSGGVVGVNYSCTYGLDDASIHAFLLDQFHWCAEVDNAEKTSEDRGYRTVDGLGDRAEWTNQNGLLVFFGDDCMQFYNEDAKFDRDGSLAVDEGLFSAFRARLKSAPLCTGPKPPALCP